MDEGEDERLTSSACGLENRVTPGHKTLLRFACSLCLSCTHPQEGWVPLPPSLSLSVGAPGEERLVLAALSHPAQPLRGGCFLSLTPYLYFPRSRVDCAPPS